MAGHYWNLAIQSMKHLKVNCVDNLPDDEKAKVLAGLDEYMKELSELGKQIDTIKQ